MIGKTASKYLVCEGKLLESFYLRHECTFAHVWPSSANTWVTQFSKSAHRTVRNKVLCTFFENHLSHILLWHRCAQGLVPNPDLFGTSDPNLTTLRTSVGVPLLLYHAFMCSNRTMYDEYYPGIDFINTSAVHDRSWQKAPIANPAPHSSFEFYDLVMTRYADAMADGGWEVDFMDFDYFLFPDLTGTLGHSRLWTKGMADAAFKHNVTVQYCMSLSSYILQTLEYPSVTNARASEDNFPGSDAATGRWRIGYASHTTARIPYGPPRTRYGLL